MRKEFPHLAIDDMERSNLNHAQITKKLMDFKKTGMESMNHNINSCQQQSEEETPAPRLCIAAEESGITTIPAPILESMFEKASKLLATKGNVIPKPGAGDASFIVADRSNNVHSSQSGQGGFLNVRQNMH